MVMLLVACSPSGRAPKVEVSENQLPWVHQSTPPTTTGLVSGQVQSIIDGDTVSITVLRQTVTVRLLGIDTPEKSGGPRPPECFGAEASAFLAELIPIGSEVLVSRDQESRDQYGRLLGWLHRPDGVFVNLAMVESGHASVLFFPPNNSLEELFTSAGYTARRQNLGFWSSCGGPDITLNR